MAFSDASRLSGRANDARCSRRSIQGHGPAVLPPCQQLKFARGRLIPAKYVRPYSKGLNNDLRGGRQIAEAVQRVVRLRCGKAREPPGKMGHSRPSNSAPMPTFVRC
jgi:hypothetical protein